MFLPSHLYTGSGSDQKVPAPAPQHWFWYSTVFIPVQCFGSAQVLFGSAYVFMRIRDPENVHMHPDP